MDVQVEEPVSTTSSPVSDSSLPDSSPTDSNVKLILNNNEDIYSVKPKQESNNKTDGIEFINGPAKLKKKWVDFMGGQSVVDSMGLSKDSIKRQEVIYEMIDTERDYVNDLSIIIELYIKPLKSNNLITKKDLNTLFSNVEQIYGVNKELLSLFEKRQQENPYVNEIGDIWLTMNDYLKMYLLYCSNYATALTRLEELKNIKNFSKFLMTQFQNPESRCLKLDSFLIKPVQRICKYPLLLKEILKYTDQTSKDYDNLNNGYTKLQTVVNVVNGASKVVEAIYNLIDFQSRFNPKISIVSPNRKIKYKGEVTIFMKKNTNNSSSQDLLNSGHNLEKKKRLLYIFNDLIIIAKPLTQETNLEKGKLKLLEKRELSEVEVHDTPQDGEFKNENIIEMNFANPEVLNLIFCESEAEKNELLTNLNSTLSEYQAKNSDYRPKVVKRLPSEKVYSMISNMSQTMSDSEEEGAETAEKEVIKIVPTKHEYTTSENIIFGVFCALLVALFILMGVLFVNLGKFFFSHTPYIYVTLFVVAVSSKFIYDVTK